MLLAPRGAVALLSVFGRRDGVTEIRWAMPSGEKKVTNQVTAGPTLLQRTWDMLDAELEAIIANQFGDDDVIAKHKNRARAIAEVLAMFMVPHFTTADEIAQEASRRHQAKLNGDTEYETPGLGSRRYEPPPGSPIRGGMESRETKAPARKRSAFKSGPKLDPAQVEFCKKALSDGTLDAPTLAGMFKVPVAVVEACNG